MRGGGGGGGGWCPPSNFHHCSLRMHKNYTVTRSTPCTIQGECHNYVAVTGRKQANISIGGVIEIQAATYYN